ncbi:hypothetical protein QBC36DRAFT_339480 [Triangularia setosa]|uniref:Uncharacterized protein n=1 Tax=Triangularia setosa TaxID=2587417 RepID=A0AAN6VYF0_9PEZI|nr:hypothetical protein QBC36DRAFT_339480 [Podospora setosa]
MREMPPARKPSRRADNPSQAKSWRSAEARRSPAQVQLVSALRLASKALAFRRGLLGNRRTTCDSPQDVASMLYKDGCVSSAM